MKILKKIIGVILIPFSVLLFISSLFSSFDSILKVKNHFSSNDNEYNTGYIIGLIIAQLFLFTVCYFLFKTGLKMINAKVSKKEIDPIDEIGIY